MGFNLTNRSDGYAYAVTAGHCDGRQPATSISTRRPGQRTKSGEWTVSVTSTGNVPGRHGDLAIFRYGPISGIPASSMGSAIVFTGNGNTTTTRTVTTRRYLKKKLPHKLPGACRSIRKGS